MSFAQDQNAAVLLDGTFVKEMVNKQEDAGGRIVETVTYICGPRQFQGGCPGQTSPNEVGNVCQGARAPDVHQHTITRSEVRVKKSSSGRVTATLQEGDSYFPKSGGGI